MIETEMSGTSPTNWSGGRNYFEFIHSHSKLAECHLVDLQILHTSMITNYFKRKQHLDDQKTYNTVLVKCVQCKLDIVGTAIKT